MFMRLRDCVSRKTNDVGGTRPQKPHLSLAYARFCRVVLVSIELHSRNSSMHWQADLVITMRGRTKLLRQLVPCRLRPSRMLDATCFSQAYLPVVYGTL